MPKSKSNANNSLTGIAGVHFVVSELSRQEVIALPTVRNTAGIDVVVVSRDGMRHANLQVKTSRNKVKNWPIGNYYRKFRGKHNYFAFVRYLADEEYFEVFLESAQKVAQQAEERERLRAKKGRGGIGPAWGLPNDEKRVARLRKKWQSFVNKFNGTDNTR